MGLITLSGRRLSMGLLERRGGDNMQTAFSAPSPVRLGRTSASALQSKSSSKLLKNISTDLKDYIMTPSRVGDKSSDRSAPFPIHPMFAALVSDHAHACSSSTACHSKECLCLTEDAQKTLWNKARIRWKLSTHDSEAHTDPHSYARSLSSSPESSGRGRSNFLQRLSSTLRDRSNRGYKKDDSSSSAQAR